MYSYKMSISRFVALKENVKIWNRSLIVFTFSVLLLVTNPTSSVEIILSYSSSPKETTLNLTQCLNPEEGMALKVEIEDPVEDGGDEAEDTMGDFTEEEKGNMVFTVLLNPGAIYTQKINISGQTTQEIPLCFDPKPKDLANVKSAKISATSDLVNDKNIKDDLKMTLVSYECDEDPLIKENKKLRQQLSDLKDTKDEYFPISYLYIVGGSFGVVLLISLFCNCWQCRKNRHLKKNESVRLTDKKELTIMNVDKREDNNENTGLNKEESDDKTKAKHCSADVKYDDTYQTDIEYSPKSPDASDRNQKYVIQKSILEKDPLIVEANSVHSKSMQKGLNKIGDQVQEDVHALLSVPIKSQVNFRYPSLLHLKDKDTL